MQGVFTSSRKKKESYLDIICPRRMQTNVQELSRALTQKKEKKSYLMNMFRGVEEILLHHFFYPLFPSLINCTFKGFTFHFCSVQRKKTSHWVPLTFGHYCS